MLNHQLIRDSNTEYIKFCERNRSEMKFRYSLQKIKEAYLAKTPFEKWNLVRSVNIWSLTPIGCQLMEANFQIHSKSYIPIYLGINYFSLMVYTLYYYRHQPLKALQATPVLGIAIPVSLISM